MQEMWVWSLGREAPLEKEMATRSSILAWEIPWTEKPGKLQSLGVTKNPYRGWNFWTLYSPGQSHQLEVLSMVVILGLDLGFGLGLNLNQ